GSGPAQTESSKAASLTVRAIGPTWASVGVALAGHTGMREKFALMPTSPVSEHGALIEPPPSVPRAIALTPAATEATAPPLEPPGVRARSHGFLVLPCTRLLV